MKKLSSAILLAAMLGLGLCMAGTVLAAPAKTADQTLDEAWTAYNIGQYNKVVQMVQPLASEGNPRAQVLLARCYENGLGVPQVLKEVTMTKRGLCILVGATGSGKSTTLAAMVDWRNENSFGHIITVEDPIEFVHPHKNCVVTQREVGLDTDSWEAALKNTLRQAPDVILMGEIRDRETMEHAVAFAETGHLCLATLHANSANQALDRIINFFPEERRAQLLMDLSLNLRAMVSQRLIPKQDGKGRAAAVEIMLNTPLIADLIFKGEVAEIKEVMKKSRNLGMQTFDQALFDAYEANVISYEDALRNADSLNDLRLQIKLNSQRAKSPDLASGTEHFAIV